MADLKPIPSDAKFKDYSGVIFGCLTVIGYAGKYRSTRCSQWLYKCACGHEAIAPISSIQASGARGCRGHGQTAAAFKDRTGEQIGCVTVISLTGRPQGASRCAKWRCRCNCGHEFVAQYGTLKRGESNDCRCHLRAPKTVVNQHIPKHLSKSYMAWRSMVARCHNPKHDNYSYYGARGISVCERWRNDFLAFVEDMGLRPDGKTLDRRENDGPYSPENCRWATHTEQMRNMRRNRFFEFRGEMLMINDIADRVSMNRRTLRSRLWTGMSVEEAVGLASKEQSTLPRR